MLKRIVRLKIVKRLVYMRRNRPGMTYEETRRAEWREYLWAFEEKHPGVLLIPSDILEVEVKDEVV